MEIIPSNVTVADYCDGLTKNEIIVNRNYQRSEEVWPAAAQSFLIETILLGFPIPKIYLHQKTDRISRKSIKEIIDGQQRTMAILGFYKGDLKLSKNIELDEAAGRSYEGLPEELQELFLSYPLGVDIFVQTEEDEVREVFRRINSYEVPLNDEEQRHARWQGEFKWYIYHLSANFDAAFSEMGTFSGKQIVRMQDMKLLTEVTHALLHGITTTNKKALDALYDEYDSRFPKSSAFQKRIERAIEAIYALEAFHETALAKPYSMYSLILAMTHMQKPVSKLEGARRSSGRLGGQRTIERRLSLLAEAVEDEDLDGPFVDFIKATKSRTNVKDQRTTRFKFFCDALAPTAIRAFARV